MSFPKALLPTVFAAALFAASAHAEVVNPHVVVPQVVSPHLVTPPPADGPDAVAPPEAGSTPVPAAPSTSGAPSNGSTNDGDPTYLVQCEGDPACAQRQKEQQLAKEIWEANLRKQKDQEESDKERERFLAELRKQREARTLAEIAVQRVCLSFASAWYTAARQADEQDLNGIPVDPDLSATSNFFGALAFSRSCFMAVP